jgi:type II secretory pathway pseudopilin PulG
LRRRGITLIEVALVLSLTGILLAAFVPTFVRYVHTSKLAEATERLASLHHHAAAYYAAEHTVGTRRLRACLPEGAGPFPLEPSADPVLVDFATDESGAATWRALGAKQPALLRYSYEVAIPEPGCEQRPARPPITLRAHGDLDGDGTRSLLERVATPGREGLVPTGPLRVLSRTE